MKLIFCPTCCDVRKLGYDETTCLCGRTSGRYLPDGRQADVSAGAVVIGLDNHALMAALHGHGPTDLRCWLMDATAPHVTWRTKRTA